jgi:hypothetical protein
MSQTAQYVSADSKQIAVLVTLLSQPYLRLVIFSMPTQTSKRGRWVFGDYAYLGQRSASELHHSMMRTPNTQNLPALYTCCYLPAIMMDMPVSVHLCRQVRQSALCKQVARALPSPIQDGSPCCFVPAITARLGATRPRTGHGTSQDPAGCWLSAEYELNG